MAELAQYYLTLKAKTDQFESSLKRADQRAARTAQAMRALALSVAGVFSVRALLGGAKDVLKAFGQQEDAVTSLRATLIATGRDGGGALEMLTQRAAELQKITRAGDEAIIQATASLGLLADKLSAADLAEAQRALVGIADTFFKGNLEAAALQVGKSIGGTTNTLSRYRIQVDMAGTQQERFAQILSQTGAFFAVSEARAETLNGRIAQMGNAWGDLKERIGAALEQGGALTEFIHKITGLLGNVAGILGQQQPEWKNLFSQLGIVVANAFSASVLTVWSQLGIAKWAKRWMQGLVDEAIENMEIAGREIRHMYQSPQSIGWTTGAPEPATIPGGGGGGRAGRAYTMGGMGVVGGGGRAPSYFGQYATVDEILTRFMPKLNTATLTAADSFRTASDITVAAFGEMVNAARWGSRSMVEYFAHGVGAILSKLSADKTGGWWGFAAGAGQALQNLQTGGVVRGSPGQAVPIIAHAGETVLPRGTGGNVIQNINFNVAAADAAGVAEFFRRNKGTIAGVVAEAAMEAPGFRRALLRGA